MFDPLDLEVPVTCAAFALEFRLFGGVVASARARWPRVGASPRAAGGNADAVPWQLATVAAIRFVVVADMPFLLTR